MKLFKAIFETSPDALIIVDREGRIVLDNPQARLLFGYGENELKGLMVEALVPESVRSTHSGHRNRFMQEPRLRPMGAGYELTAVRRDGTEFPVEIGLSPIETEQGDLFVASVRNISETLRARRALRRSHQNALIAQMGRLALNAAHYNDVVKAVPALVIDALDATGVAVLIVRPSQGEMEIQAQHGLANNVRDTLRDWLSTQVDGGRPIASGAAMTLREVEEKLPADVTAALVEAGVDDGAIVPLVARNTTIGMLVAFATTPVRFDEDSVHFLQAIADLLTARIERSRSDEQLAHVQRLDALGQLTGGIAHDFNNLLTVVSGNLQLLEDEIGDTCDAGEIIGNALRAVDRGATLTRKLLMFARRQRLVPRAIDPSQLLDEFAAMMRQTLGRTISIDVEYVADLPAIFADPAELDAVLLNLALNSRDAMPRGGRLVLAARSVRVDEMRPADASVVPGDFVVLTITDTGSGMTPEVLMHAFEPFFTTKNTSKGNGLGLSMVYGFVTQSGGFIAVESELGYGTRIEMFLPAVPISEVARQSSAPAASAHGRGTILVVEDEAQVREVAVAFLKSLGYTVVAVADPLEALQVIEGRTQIALLFSDIVLGSEMSGKDLASRARELRPALPVLLTSGYAHDPGQTSHENVVWEFLGKPYRREDLAVAVRKALREN